MNACKKTLVNKRLACLSVILTGLLVGWFGILFAQNVIQETPNGHIDWSDGVITATGLGIPPTDTVNATHADEMAKRAARVVAYRNLLEIVQGIHVDSHTLVKNFMVENDEVNTKVQGIIKGARVVKEQKFPDASYQVTVEMGLNTELPTAVIPSTTKPDPLFSVPPPQKNVVFTGLVIDAQGLDLHEALSPKILMEDGRVAYGAEWVEQEVIQGQGLVGYVRGIPAAKSNKRVVATPLVVKALRVAGKNQTDLVISDADAQTLHVIPENLAFLEKAKVLVVLD
ncbi:MAG: hypothetical protein GKS05_00085 [Nitrospirales bacterium]|nr:hypothetical protein [Nitrospirales bacterium]